MGKSINSSVGIGISDKMSMEKSDNKELTCPRCNHCWEYNGDLVKATCPSCGYKVVAKPKVLEE